MKEKTLQKTVSPVKSLFKFKSGKRNQSTNSPTDTSITLTPTLVTTTTTTY